MDELPDLPRVHSQADLHQLWRILMGPLGFGRRTLWLVFVDVQGGVGRLIMPVDIHPEPDDAFVRQLFWVCEEALGAEFGAGTRIAMLLSRPGSARVGDGDRAWARALADGAAHAGVALLPVHLATDDAIVVLPPDDLADSA